MMSKHDGKQMNMTENDGKRGCFRILLVFLGQRLMIWFLTEADLLDLM